MDQSGAPLRIKGITSETGHVSVSPEGSTETHLRGRQDGWKKSKSLSWSFLRRTSTLAISKNHDGGLGGIGEVPGGVRVSLAVVALNRRFFDSSPENDGSNQHYDDCGAVYDLPGVTLKVNRRDWIKQNGQQRENPSP
jgi:hypothetical protein